MGRFAVKSARRPTERIPVSIWLWIIIIVVVALAALAYLRRRGAG